jgi:hypothetical protein
MLETTFELFFVGTSLREFFGAVIFLQVQSQAASKYAKLDNNTQKLRDENPPKFFH